MSQDSEFVYSEHAGDKSYAELLAQFADAILQTKAKLQILHRHQQIAQLQRQVHQLKGAGGGYGFPGLTMAARNVEIACKSNDAAAIEQTLNDLITYIDRLRF